jgi:nucleoside-diphosphate-sugar epimerase
MNIAGNSSITIVDLARMIKDGVVGCDSQIIHTPPRVGDVRESAGSTELIASVLGFKPEIALEEGISRTIDWFRSKRTSADAPRSL